PARRILRADDLVRTAFRSADSLITDRADCAWTGRLNLLPARTPRMWSPRLLRKLGGVFLGVFAIALAVGLLVASSTGGALVAWLLIGSLLVAATATALTFWIIRRVRRPVADVIAIAQALAAGDYDYPTSPLS